MMNVTKLTFDHETAPVGLDHAPVFGWQLTGDCRDIRQTMAQLQIAMTPDFAAPVFDELLPGKNSIAVQAAGFAPRALTRYYARVQIKADTAAGLQTSDWSAPGSFVTALLDQSGSGVRHSSVRRMPTPAGNPLPARWCGVILRYAREYGQPMPVQRRWGFTIFTSMVRSQH